MVEPPAAAVPKLCCVCDATGGKHCTKCKSRHYCSKACQLVDWNERGHKAQCKQMAAEFQDRLLGTLMPEKLKIKEAPAIVADALLADGSKTAARSPAVMTDKTVDVKASALNDDAPDWRGTCAICFDVLQFGEGATFYDCCCKSTCTACNIKCQQYDMRCPLCRTPPCKWDDEVVRRLQKHVVKGNADAQVQLAGAYHAGNLGLTQSFKLAFQLYDRAAKQGHAGGQAQLGVCYATGEGVEKSNTAAALWYRRAAEQGHSAAQCNIGLAFHQGNGVAQSHAEAVKWFRVAAAQGLPDAFYYLGKCHARGHGVPMDESEAMRLYKLAAVKGHAAGIKGLEAYGQPT